VTSKAEDYRRRARACLLMAGTIADDETRAALVEMAQVWTRLADEDAAAAPPDMLWRLRLESERPVRSDIRRSRARPNAIVDVRQYELREYESDGGTKISVRTFNHNGANHSRTV
jgi:hypothetical protein